MGNKGMVKTVVAEGVGRGMEQQFRISRCKLLYREWISNRVYCRAQGAIFNIL